MRDEFTGTSRDTVQYGSTACYVHETENQKCDDPRARTRIPWVKKYPVNENR